MPIHRHDVILETDMQRSPRPNGNGNGIGKWINWKVGLKDIIWILIIIVTFFVQRKGIEDAIEQLGKQQALNTLAIEAVRQEMKMEYLLKEVENQRDLSIEQRLGSFEALERMRRER